MKGEHGAREDLYRGVHRVVVEELASHGVTARPYREEKPIAAGGDAFLCFQRRTPEDLILSGYKILGSAQRRVRRSVLQHGSLLLRASRFAGELPGIFDLASKNLAEKDLAEGITERLAVLLGVRFETGRLSPSEINAAETIALERFGSESWWFRR